MEKSFLRTQIWLRFLARQLDILVVHVFALVIYSKVSLYYEINPLVIFLISLFFYTIIESLLIHYFKTTLGKFILGIKVETSSLLNSFKRSFSVYLKGIGLGIPLVYEACMFFSFLKSKKQDLSWEKYGTISFNEKNIFKGLVILLVLNMTMMKVFYREPALPESTENVNNLPITVVNYKIQKFEDKEVDSLELWKGSCLLGAEGVAKIYNIRLDYELIKYACLESQTYMTDEDEMEVIYLKACGMGVGIALQDVFGDKTDQKTLEEEAEVLKKICLPDNP